MLSVDIYQNIPAELRDMANWVVWKCEEESGRPTKVPYQPNGRKAKSNTPATWSSFSEVLQALQASDEFAGPGFCVPLDGSVHIWGFDLDDAIDPETGEFNEWRLENGDLAPIQPRDGLDLNSYGEITPSGAGYRVMVKANVPVPKGKKREFGDRNPKTGKTPGIEMYSSGRFFTFTGNKLPGSPATLEERTEQALALHLKMFPTTAQAPSKNTADAPSKPVGEIEQLAFELCEGRTGPRNNLMFGISGVLVGLGWKRPNIEMLLKYLILMFHDADPQYDVQAAIEKQMKTLDTLYDRATAKGDIPSFNYLADVVNPETLAFVRKLKSRDQTSTSNRSVEDTLAMIRKQPPESFDRQEIRYLIEPEIPKGALVLITGKPGSGKSTLVMHWCYEMAEAGADVLYLDRDNPLFIAQDRVERFGGRTAKNLMYWGLWTKDAEGEPLEPPYPASEFLKDAVRTMINPVLVFDTFATFSSGDENDNALVGATFRHFRHLTNLGATLLVIHHTGKNADSNSRGASAMEGAVDAGIKVVGTIEEGKLTRIEVETFKTRIGDGRPILYGMRDGIPRRETATFTDILFDLVRRNPGLSKDKFEEVAKKSGFRRSTVREFLDNGIVSGRLKYEKCKLYAKVKDAPVLPHATVSFDDDELFQRSVAAAVQ